MLLIGMIPILQARDKGKTPRLIVDPEFGKTMDSHISDNRVVWLSLLLCLSDEW